MEADLTFFSADVEETEAGGLLSPSAGLSTSSRIAFSGEASDGIILLLLLACKCKCNIFFGEFFCETNVKDREPKQRGSKPRVSAKGSFENK